MIVRRKNPPVFIKASYVISTCSTREHLHTTKRYLLLLFKRFEYSPILERFFLQQIEKILGKDVDKLYADDFNLKPK